MFLFYLSRTPAVFDECDIDKAARDLLLQDIRHRLMPQAVKLRADFEVSCFAYEGIEAVRRALRRGLEFSTDELPIKPRIVSDTDESELRRHMEELEDANKEVSGDDDDDEEDAGNSEEDEEADESDDEEK
ncbi:unnamed protein product [Dibothriocephalus latus]|uniref:Uncharacterized protein n=1 Tax=Dibothriocephalus latus TaxID=60516 RepID=A0A3P7LWC5_DIBLA|nr:unnamed protein product [Dibothriocephalus latus]